MAQEARSLGVYEPRQEVRLRIQVKNASGALANPSTLTVKVKNGAGAEVLSKAYPADAEVVADATGRFHIDFTPAVAATTTDETTWYVAWYSTGTPKVAGERPFTVRASRFA